MSYIRVSSMGTQNGPPPRGPWFFLAEWRRFRGFTQAALGAELGVDKSTINRYEKRERKPDIDDIFTLAAALKIRPMDLFRSPRTPSLDDLVKDMPEDDRRRASDFIDALKRTARTDESDLV